ncbi:hypothetical protein HH214_06000 [Mucilaginibacter robiniae]|uniref:Uncharacterized protein n=1 Tax=Mucilaginibacter robiniae TaxID=2728022 RepID=A0A7L5DZ20_9SPHI|nr:hypothetical protein [Mucilaginibacter robiniae]QJD95458.1 hypothetical protein HH214_06000 [Mucilaginibacter robiniae]
MEFNYICIKKLPMYLPQNYQEWYRCITVDCKIEPSAEFFKQRIQALLNESDSYTQDFISLYGIEYHQQVVQWFEQASLQVS